MKIPTIHLNGTSRQELIDQLCEAMNAIRLAERAMETCCPNGRDYYPQGPAAFADALDEHTQRVVAITRIRHELNEIAESIAAG